MAAYRIDRNQSIDDSPASLSRALAPSIVIVLLLGLLAYGLSPFYCAYKLRSAAQNNDRDGIEAGVDFPVLRESIKSQVTAALGQEIRTNRELRENAIAVAGEALLGPAITDRLIDGMITPDGIMGVINNGRPDFSTAQRTADRPTGSTSSGADLKFAYLDVDRFRITVGAESNDVPLVMYFRRYGLFTWRLVRSIFHPRCSQTTTLQALARRATGTVLRRTHRTIAVRTEAIQPDSLEDGGYQTFHFECD